MISKRILYLLIFSFALKVLLALIVPVFADEAYYYVWSLHSQLSYFDHPPMVSWFISMGEFLFPLKNSLSLRSFFILASTIAMISWVAILKRKNYSDKHIEYFLILMLLNPLLGPGSIIATPDVPLVLFWSLSYLFFLDVLNKKTAAAYSLLGACLGLGFCSKYHIVLFVLCGLVYLAISKQYKKLVPVKILLTIFFGLIFSFPVIYWNYLNDWSSFSFQLNHGLGRTYYDVSWTLGFVAAQILILNPFLLTNLFRKNENNQADRVFSLTQFTFFFVSSFKAVVEANWPITSHLHATSYAAQSVGAKKFKWAAGYWIFIYIVGVALALIPQTQSIFKNQISQQQLKEVLPLVDQYKPLYGPNYQVSSLLTWMGRKEIYKLRGLTRYDFYDSLVQSVPQENEFYVLKHMTSYWPEYMRLELKPEEVLPNIKITKIQSFEGPQLELFRVRYE